MTRLVSFLAALFLATNVVARVPGKDLPAKTQWLAQQGWTWFVRQINLDKVLKEIETQAQQSKKTAAPTSSSQAANGKSKQQLPYKEGDPVPEWEKRIVELINAEREKAGLNKLLVDPVLTEVARDRGRDMITRDYYSHYTPEGEGVWDWLGKRGYTYVHVAENLSGGRESPEVYHHGFMNSQGHRDNILRPGLTHVGVGVVRGLAYFDFIEHPNMTTCVEVFVQK
ncbi:MAG: CAP domain-containing protein [Anaerolineae bacterium]